MLLRAGGVVGLEVAEGVLDAGEDVVHHGGVGVDVLAVAEDFDEDTAFAFAADPAEGVVAVGALELLFGFVLVAHFDVVDAGEDVDVFAGEGVLHHGVGFVVDLELLAVEHGGERAFGVVDLDSEELRVAPVIFEEAADHGVELGPGAGGRAGGEGLGRVVGVDGGVDADQAFAAANEVEQGLFAGGSGCGVFRIVEEGQGGAIEKDGVVLGEVLGGDVGGVVGDGGGVGAGLFAHGLNGGGGERDGGVDVAGGLAEDEDLAGLLGGGWSLGGDAVFHGDEIFAVGGLDLDAVLEALAAAAAVGSGALGGCGRRCCLGEAGDGEGAGYGEGGSGEASAGEKGRSGQGEGPGFRGQLGPPEQLGHGSGRRDGLLMKLIRPAVGKLSL